MRIGFGLRVIILTLAACLALSSSASAYTAEEYFDAALCKAPYFKIMTGEGHFDAAIFKPINRNGDMGAVFEFKYPLTRNGFEAAGIVFSFDLVGVIIKGKKIDNLAKKYNLGDHNQKHLFGANEASRVVPMPSSNPATNGILSINAFETETGDTLLFCQSNTPDQLEQEKALIENPGKPGR